MRNATTAPANEPRPIVWLTDEVTAPPFGEAAKVEAYDLLTRLCAGERIGMPHSRPMPSIGRRCHELRITDENCIWRIFYRTDPDAIVIAEVLQKRTQATPPETIRLCRNRYRRYDAA